MRLHNTLTRTIEDIRPLHAPKVAVYTCGPTVYDYAHIGHWFNYIRMDSLIRTLRASELQPTWVMNITDVGHLVSDADEGEDKLEKGARREGKTAWQVAEFYTKDFLNGMKLLNITTPTHIVKATDHIEEQIALIQRLESKGYTYQIDDGIYFDTSRFEGYAAFARLDLSEQQGSGRVSTNSQKRQQSDFALWKFSPTDHQRDMEWDSPWGKGFPGWHIECSAMSMRYLGETIDIHTGGIDHIPVHHTNEIAQSEAATGVRFANYWMHGNHVLVNGDKIAKSSGNGIRLDGLLEMGISAMAIRLHVLESNYRNQSQFSIDSLQAAANRLKGFQAVADLRFQATASSTADTASGQTQLYDSTYQAILAAMQNDLNSPIALMELNRFQDIIIGQMVRDDTVGDFAMFLEKLDSLLGLQLLTSSDITEDQKELIKTRNQARQSKDFAASDSIRQTLLEQGIVILDTDSQTVWRRI